MERSISLRIGDEDIAALEKVYKHYKATLKIPINVNSLYRMAMLKLAEEIDTDKE